MQRSTTLLLLAFIFAASVPTVWAQTESTQNQSRQITLQEAIDIALENNYALKQAKNELNLSEDRIKSEYADFLPSVSGRLGGDQNKGQQFIADRFRQGLNPFVSITQQSMSGSINTNINVFSGFENIHSLRASQQRKISREEEYQRQKESVIFQTASAYLQVLVDKELLDIRKENLRTSEKVLEQTRAQVEVGSRPSVDLYNQEATVANNELLVTQQENQLMINKLALVRQLQIDPMGDYQFEVPQFDKELTTEIASMELRELVNQAMQNRSDLRSSQASIKNLKLQHQMSRLALLPSISASAGISSRYSDQYSFQDEVVAFNDQFFDQQVNKSIGFSISVPLFSNWDRMYNIQSAQVNMKNAKLNLENTKQQVVQDVTQAYNDYTSYVKQFEAAKKSLRANEKAFETQQERYKVGASTQVELSQAQSAYVEARSEHTQAMYRLIFQEKLLDYFLGKLNSEQVSF